MENDMSLNETNIVLSSKSYFQTLQTTRWRFVDLLLWKISSKELFHSTSFDLRRMEIFGKHRIIQMVRQMMHTIRVYL